MSTVAEHRALLIRALGGYLDRESREAFDGMLRVLSIPGSRRALTPGQASWVRRALDEQAAHPERTDNASSQTPPMLRRENLPMRPPGRRA